MKNRVVFSVFSFVILWQVIHIFGLGSTINVPLKWWYNLKIQNTFTLHQENSSITLVSVCLHTQNVYHAAGRPAEGCTSSLAASYQGLVLVEGRAISYATLCLLQPLSCTYICSVWSWMNFDSVSLPNNGWVSAIIQITLSVGKLRNNCLFWRELHKYKYLSLTVMFVVLQTSDLFGAAANTLPINVLLH